MVALVFSIFGIGVLSKILFSAVIWSLLIWVILAFVINGFLDNKEWKEERVRDLLKPAQSDADLCQRAAPRLEQWESCRNWRDRALAHRELLVLDLMVIRKLEEQETVRKTEQESLQGLVWAGQEPS